MLDPGRILFVRPVQRTLAAQPELCQESVGAGAAQLDLKLRPVQPAQAGELLRFDQAVGWRK